MKRQLSASTDTCQFILVYRRKNMKVGIVYTSTTPELIETVNTEIRKNLGDTPEIADYQDPLPVRSDFLRRTPLRPGP